MALFTRGINGIRFRSRLEARWAAFFSLMRWPFEYEPELELHEWIPDFWLKTGAGMLVEVKPARTLAQLVPHRQRIEASRHVGPVWLVGAALAFPVDGAVWYGSFGVGNGAIWDWRPMTGAELVEQTGTNASARYLNAAWIAAGNELQWRRK